MFDNIWHIWQLFAFLSNFSYNIWHILYGGGGGGGGGGGDWGEGYCDWGSTIYHTYLTTFWYFNNLLTDFRRSINLWPLFAIVYSFWLIFGGTCWPRFDNIWQIFLETVGGGILTKVHIIWPLFAILSGCSDNIRHILYWVGDVTIFCYFIIFFEDFVHISWWFEGISYNVRDFYTSFWDFDQILDILNKMFDILTNIFEIFIN